MCTKEEKTYCEEDLLDFIGRPINVEHDRLKELADWFENVQYGEMAGEGWVDIDLRPFTDYLEYNDAWFAAHNSWFTPDDEKEDDAEEYEIPDGFLLKVVLWFEISPTGIITSVDLSARVYADYGDHLYDCEFNEDLTQDDYANAIEFLNSIADQSSRSIYANDDQERVF